MFILFDLFEHVPSFLNILNVVNVVNDVNDDNVKIVIFVMIKATENPAWERWLSSPGSAVAGLHHSGFGCLGQQLPLHPPSAACRPARRPAMPWPSLWSSCCAGHRLECQRCPPSLSSLCSMSTRGHRKWELAGPSGTSWLPQCIVLQEPLQNSALEARTGRTHGQPTESLEDCSLAMGFVHFHPWMGWRFEKKDLPKLSPVFLGNGWGRDHPLPPVPSPPGTPNWHLHGWREHEWLANQDYRIKKKYFQKIKKYKKL